jgi:hypothetical protein
MKNSNLLKLLVASLAFCNAGWAQDTRQSVTAMDARTVADKLIRPNNGAVALIINEQGRIVVVDREGKTLPSCQVCTPELERRYGPKCVKAKKVSELALLDGREREEAIKEADAQNAPLICDKLMSTNVQDVEPISVVRHTGSQCMSFFVNSNGQAKVWQYCW